MKKKKIAILSLHLGYGGIEKSIVALANLLVKDYDVEIACTYKLYDEPVFKLDDDIKVKYLVPDYKPNKQDFKNAFYEKKIISFFKEGFKAAKVLRLKRTTMVNYINNVDADVVISTRDLFDRWLEDSIRSDILKIGWEHNHYHDDLKYAGNVTRSCAKLDYLVLVSKQLQKFYRRELINSKCKCIYIPNTIDSIPKRCAPLNEKRLISVGRLSKEKGYIDLLKMYYLLSKNHSSWHLDIIGDGLERKRLQRFIDEHKLSTKVTLHGFQNKEYIDKMLNKSSVYLMTSFTESFGIVLIEAMSHGIPCIAFNSAEGAREIITSGHNGYLIKRRNYNAFIKKVEDLMKDLEVRKTIGRNARKSVKKYTADVVREDWLKILEKKEK